MNIITRIAINILIGLGACIAVTAPPVAAMLTALSLFDQPSDFLPTMIVMAGFLAGLGAGCLYGIITEPFLPFNRE